MPNPTPHTPNPQTPHSGNEGNLNNPTSLQMKPIEISDKLRERVRRLREQLPEMGPRVQALVDEEKRRKRQVEELKQQEYIEINGIRLDKENLGKPTHPDIIINPSREERKMGLPCCWNNGDNWYYNWHAAMLEAKYLGKRLPTMEELNEIIGIKKDSNKLIGNFIEFTEKLNLKVQGIYHKSIFYNINDNINLWIANRFNSSRACILKCNKDLVTYNMEDKSNLGLTVRCIFPEPEKVKEETELKEFLRKIQNDNSDLYL